MERRVLLAIFLSFLVLYAYQALVVKPVPPKPTAVASSSTEQPAPSATAEAPATGAHATPPPNPSPVPTAQPLVADAAERDVRVETNEVIAVFTNRGARLKSWRLKRYFGRDGQPQEIIESDISSQPL